jgi:hypothetical protein
MPQSHFLTANITALFRDMDGYQRQAEKIGDGEGLRNLDPRIIAHEGLSTRCSAMISCPFGAL